MYSDHIWQWLDTCLDYGITEADFWQMTFAELNRLLASKRRVLKIQQQERAHFDHTLADLIGRSVARIYSATATLPTKSDAYPSLFNADEERAQIEEKRTQLSVLRFQQFAKSHNRKMQEVSKAQ